MQLLRTVDPYAMNCMSGTWPLRPADVYVRRTHRKMNGGRMEGREDGWTDGRMDIRRTSCPRRGGVAVEKPLRRLAFEDDIG